MRAKRNLTAERRTAALEAEAELEREGLRLPPKPKFESPQVPTRLAELDDDTLMNLFVRLTRWADYLNGQLALAMIEERSAEGRLAIAEATALLGNWGGTKEDRVALSKAERDLVPEVVEHKDDLAIKYAKRKLIEVLFTSAERDSAVVSRELTRRVGRMEINERRVGKWTP